MTSRTHASPAQPHHYHMLDSHFAFVLDIMHSNMDPSTSIYHHNIDYVLAAFLGCLGAFYLREQLQVAICT